MADRLDIPFYALDFEQDFDRIIDYFADEYLAGRTPNPCVVCNNWLKFGKLWSYGKQLEADFIATGHYAQVVRDGGDVELHRAADPDKDQSYVLYGLRRAILPHLLFPIGGYRKDEVRAAGARRRGWAWPTSRTASRSASCPTAITPALIRERRPELATAGQYRRYRRQRAGRARRHRALHHRPAQGPRLRGRRAALRPADRAGDNEVVVGDREELLASGLVASRVNWLMRRRRRSRWRARRRFAIATRRRRRR